MTRYVCTRADCDFTTTALDVAMRHIEAERWHWVERQRPIDMIGFLAAHDDIRDAFGRVRALLGKPAR